MILAFKHRSSQPLSARTSAVHREEASEACRRARRRRPLPGTVATLTRIATPVLKGRASGLRHDLPRLVSRHPLRSIVASFAAGLLVGKTLLSITRR